MGAPRWEARRHVGARKLVTSRVMPPPSAPRRAGAFGFGKDAKHHQMLIIFQLEKFPAPWVNFAETGARKRSETALLSTNSPFSEWENCGNASSWKLRGKTLCVKILRKKSFCYRTILPEVNSLYVGADENLTPANERHRCVAVP